MARSFIEQDPRNLIAFGCPFIANADLVNKVAQGYRIKAYQKEMLNVLN